MEKAISYVQNLDKTNKDKIVVCIEAGEYYTNGIYFNSLDSGNEQCQIIYCGYGGEVILNAGINLNRSDFFSATNYSNLINRLNASAIEYVKVLDLKSDVYNLTKNDWGNLFAIGTYNTTDNSGTMYSELFVDDQRYKLAQYPNSGYLYTGEVINNDGKQGEKFKVNNDLSNRIGKYSNIQDVWLYGFWKYDWADGSTPIAGFDKKTNILTTQYNSFFGLKENSPYIIYNSLEELDCEGEWYLDRENGLLCLYKSNWEVDSKILLSFSTNNVISINANNISIENITIKGTRADGVVINGNNNKIVNCKIIDIGGSAILCNGYNNEITNNNINTVAKSGIAVNGGNRAQLLAGNNIVKENIIHDWSQVYKTYQSAINFGGVGNICSCNLIYNSPHLAITYDGNNHIFENNVIHDVCLETNDAGAIYAGKSYISYGNHIRYNLIYNIGAKNYTPNGIYMDDAISGQSIYGNLLINIPNYAIFIGGGRDMLVYENVIINAKNSAIRYDARARDAVLNKTWFSEDLENLIKDLQNSFYKTEKWQQMFLQYQTLSENLKDIEKSNCVANPANSVIENNLIFDATRSIGNVDKSVFIYSLIYNNSINYLFKTKKYFYNFTTGDYRLKKNGFISEKTMEQLSKFWKKETV